MSSVSAGGHELVAEYLDDGHSGARLDRPGLDALRDAAEAGLFEAVWCLSPDRLARAYAYQVLVLDELARFGVTGAFTDAPGPAADDPQAMLLTQVQGVIAEYEKAKIAERYRRGKLFRARAGEITAWKAALRLPPRRAQRGQRPGASGDLRTRSRGRAPDLHRHASPAATDPRDLPPSSTPTLCPPRPAGRPGAPPPCSRLLRNEAYIGRVYYNRTETVAAPGPARAHPPGRPTPARSGSRSRLPPIIDRPARSTAASRVARRQHQVEPARAPNPARGCSRAWSSAAPAGVGTNCHQMRGRNGTWHRYYYCRNHDPLRAGGEHRRCPERNIRADALDELRLRPVRAALPQPGDTTGRRTSRRAHTPTPDDELLAAELARLDRKIDHGRPPNAAASSTSTRPGSRHARTAAARPRGRRPPRRPDRQTHRARCRAKRAGHTATSSAAESTTSPSRSAGSSTNSTARNGNN